VLLGTNWSYNNFYNYYIYYNDFYNYYFYNNHFYNYYFYYNDFYNYYFCNNNINYNEYIYNNYYRNNNRSSDAGPHTVEENSSEHNCLYGVFKGVPGDECVGS